ncbi:M14 family metallopeptidase [Alteromonas oceanisediminis]|uniref:M14 family metallopeptidase n=1 Tax=Alteromonas oceanisediminis TaxID=2836180 RepID=UPI001BDAA640|nr:M14 family metallocarboxypeptidase [Alteromonas oceanisediminis]MBT0586827.1 M14 family metallocarboxypeptidase [Alteromonas oceanisediminis]
MTYPVSIGTPGKPWGEPEINQWREMQQRVRSYQEQVLDKIDRLDGRFERVQYGALPYDEQRYPLYALKTKEWQRNKPYVLVTGGVHGYETSGVQGALAFLDRCAEDYAKHFNIIVVPCISPWGYETINRWNPHAVDPNRSFFTNSPSPEAAQVMALVEGLNVELLAHFDLHETTDTDNTEFRPALADRDGTTHDEWTIPDGFYTVDDTSRANQDFQAAVIASVEKVTHIAPPDEHGKIIGADVTQHGVIHYDKTSLHLCGGFTNAQYVTTTEVYPDSEEATPAQCIDAQVAAITGGLDYLLTQK